MKRNSGWILMLCLVTLFAAGCGKQADTSKPLDQVKAEAEKMSVSDLQSTAQAYAKEIAGKQSEISKVQDKLKGLSPQELFGDKAKSIKDEISKVGSEMQALTQRYDIYASKFKEMGGDVSKIKVS